MKNRPHRRQRKSFPPWRGRNVPTDAGTLQGYRAYALKTRRQFSYLGLAPPKFGEL